MWYTVAWYSRVPKVHVPVQDLVHTGTVPVVCSTSVCVCTIVQKVKFIFKKLKFRQNYLSNLPEYLSNLQYMYNDVSIYLQYAVHMYL